MVECSDASGGASGDASPLFDGALASRAFHARSLLATIQMRFIGEPPNSIWQFTGARPHPTWCNCQLTVDVIRKVEPKVHANNHVESSTGFRRPF